MENGFLLSFNGGPRPGKWLEQGQCMGQRLELGPGLGLIKGQRWVGTAMYVYVNIMICQNVAPKKLGWSTTNSILFNV